MNQESDAEQRQLSLFSDNNKKTEASISEESKAVVASPPQTADVLPFDKHKQEKRVANSRLTDRVLSLLKL